MQTAAGALERQIQLPHALPDELHAPVGTVLQCVEYPGIEHEHAVHAPRVAQRMTQGGVVVDA